MFKFLIRMFSLAVIAGLFLAVSAAAIKLAETSSFWSRHHGVALAYLGTVLSLSSMVYSLRKYRVLLKGALGTWLKGHIVLGSAGILLVLTHSRFELQALVPSASLVAMALVGVTGLFGWYMYRTKVQALLSEIKSLEEAEEVVLAKMASSALRFWRFVHVVATFAAIFFTIVHGISLVVFRG